MDKYINLAELRKTTEALLYKLQMELDTKLGENDININPIVNDDNYSYNIGQIGNNILKIPSDWVMAIVANIPKRAFLPTVSQSDNGKILRVVDGYWNVVNLPSASGVSF